MHHLAIMNKSWKLIPKILSGEKTIESRWYVSRRAPWDKIKAGDMVYFKNPGEPVTAVARVSQVKQFALANLNDTQKVVDKYGKKICLINSKVRTWGKAPKYCILIWLEGAKGIKPFQIDKTGFGNASAWVTVVNINKIRVE